MDKWNGWEKAKWIIPGLALSFLTETQTLKSENNSLEKKAPHQVAIDTQNAVQEVLAQENLNPDLNPQEEILHKKWEEILKLPFPQILEEMDVFLSQNLYKLSSLDFILQMRETAQKKGGAPKYESRAHLYLGDYFRRIKNDNQKALEAYQTAFSFSENPPDVQVSILNKIGITWKNLGSLDEAQKSYIQALDLEEEITEEEREALFPSIYVNMGTIYRMNGELEKAEENYLQALELFEKKKDSSRLAISLQNIAPLYVDLKKMDKAKESIEKMKQIYTALDNEVGIADSYSLLGFIHYESGELKEALENFEKTLSLLEKLEKEDHYVDNQKIARMNYNIGETYFQLQEFTKANEHLLKALKEVEVASIEHEILKTLSRSYKNLGERETQKGNPYQALKYYELFTDYNDLKDSLTYELFEIEKQKSLTDVNVKYETEQIQREKEQAEELAQEAQKRQILLLGLLILLGTGAIYIFLQKNKIKRINKEIFSTNEELQEKNKKLEISEANLKDAQSILQNMNTHLEKIVEAKSKELKNKNEELENALQDLRVTLRELEQAHRQLEELDESKSQFLGLLSHNFATPISNILQALSFINIVVPSEEKGKDWHEKFEENVLDPLSSATYKLRDRIYLMQTALELQNKTRTVMKEFVPLETFQNNIAYMTRDWEHRLSMNFDFHTSESVLNIDETLIAEIVKIMLSNVEDFQDPKKDCVCELKKDPRFKGLHEQDSCVPRVQIKTREDEKNIYLDFIDQGKGFSPKALKNFGKLLSPGEELQNLHDGLGLGIFTAKLIMIQQGGDIQAQNNKKRGATVTLRFPKYRLEDL